MTTVAPVAVTSLTGFPDVEGIETVFRFVLDHFVRLTGFPDVEGIETELQVALAQTATSDRLP